MVLESERMQAHRIGPQRQSPSAPRVLIVKCLRYTDRDRILKEARANPFKVDGQTIGFTADYSDYTWKLRHVMHRDRLLG